MEEIIESEKKQHQIPYRELLLKGKELVGKTMTFGGWARSVRKAEKGAILFLQLTDGSCHKDLQVIVRKSDNHPNFDEISGGNVGWSFMVTGKFVDCEKNENGDAREQLIEMIASSVKVLGTTTDYKQYPLQKRGKEERKKGIPIDRMREIPHLRSRTYLFSAIFRLRNCLAMATHKYFQSQNCMWVSAPLIKFSDCEGAGEAFIVTTDEELEHLSKKAVEDNKQAVKDKLPSVNPTDTTKNTTDDIIDTTNDKSLKAVDADAKHSNISTSESEGRIKESKGKEEIVVVDEHPMNTTFFKERAYLTVSA